MKQIGSIETKKTGSNETKKTVLDAKTEFDVNAVGKSELLESDQANQTDINTMPKSGIYDTALYYMTPDEIAFLSHLGLKDKLSALTILSKLGTDDVDRIYDMCIDGVTFEEFAEMNAAAEDKLAVSDVQALKEILYRNKMLYAENGK